MHLLDHGLVFFAGLHRRDAHALNLDAAEVAPLRTQNLLQRLGKLHGAARKLGIANALGRDLGEGGLKRRQKLALQLAVNLLAGIGVLHVAAHIRIEQQRVHHLVAVLTEAADGDVDVNTSAIVHHAEGHGRGRAVLVAHELLDVEVVHTLVHGGLAAEGEALADVLEAGLNRRTQLARENRRFGRRVIGVLARLRAHVNHLALLHDEHALTIGNRDDRAVGDDVIGALGVGRAPR